MKKNSKRESEIFLFSGVISNMYYWLYVRVR